MYWFREGSYWGILIWGACALMSSTGGIWLISTLFDVQDHEIPVLGFGSGLVLYLWFTNLLGHFLSPALAFLLPAPLICLLGFTARRIDPKKKLRVTLKTILVQASVFLILTGFFTLTGRGLAIFDERKNLSLISLMANGDIPPHNPLNPLTLYQYHYGSQLLGASLVKLGGFFPLERFRYQQRHLLGSDHFAGLHSHSSLYYQELGGSAAHCRLSFSKWNTLFINGVSHKFSFRAG